MCVLCNGWMCVYVGLNVWMRVCVGVWVL
jgi:hypothetical protein